MLSAELGAMAVHTRSASGSSLMRSRTSMAGAESRDNKRSMNGQVLSQCVRYLEFEHFAQILAVLRQFDAPLLNASAICRDCAGMRSSTRWQRGIASPRAIH